MKKSEESKAKPKSERAKLEAGLPVVVSARYPPALLAEVDAARGDQPRQRWLVDAARQRLERDRAQRAIAEVKTEAQG